MDEIVVHVKFEGGTDEPEIFRVPAETVWMDLECMLKAQFDCEEIKVFYIDPEGDYVTIGSQEELFEAFRVAHSCDKTLHVVVRDLGPDCVIFREDDTPPAPTPSVVNTGTNTAEPEAQAAGSSVDPVVKVDIMELVTETTVIVDKATGEITAEVTEKPVTDERVQEIAIETNSAEKEDQVLKEPPEMLIRMNRPPGFEAIIIERNNVIENQPRRQERERRHLTYSVDRGARHRRARAACDQESGEEVAMPYSVFVKYMHQLKQELRTEIVKDVTKKTVRHVLKGLDGAVIQSVQGTPAGNSPVGNEPGITTPLAAAGDSNNAADPTSSHPIYYHESVVCDFCERVIVGARYKCCNCVDYDLCEECEAIHGVHDWDHVFLKIRKPVKIRRSTPLLKHTLYKPQAQPLEMEADQQQNPNIPAFLMSKVAKIQEKTLRKQERLKRKEEKLLHKQKKKEEILKRRMEGQGEKPLKKERLDLSSKSRLMTMNSSLLYDVTIPDGTSVQPGTKLLKTWRMKNTGAFAWDDSTKIHHIFGLLPVNKQTDVDVPHVKPEDECDVSVELEAPEKPGKYQSHWKMTHKGNQFGYRVWCEIFVEPRQLLEPTKDSLLQMVNIENNDQALARPEQEVVIMTQPLSEVKINMDKELTPENTVITSESQQTNVTINTVDIENVKSDIQTQEKIEKPAPEGENSEEVEAVNTDKLHQDLNTAAAAVAQLKLDQEQPDTKTTGQDLMTFELLDIGTRATPKVSQTATPNNTPLDVSPPPEMEDFKVLSQSSSVEVVNNNTEEEDPASDYVQDILSSLPGPKPSPATGEEADIESLKSFTDDSMSLSEDDDFLMVPMPACFDFSKPISRSILEQLSDDDDDDEDEEEEVDDNHNRITNTDNRDVDDILTTSRDTSTPVLEPQPADNSSPSEQIPAEQVQDSTAVSQADNVTTAAEMAPQTAETVSIATSAAGAASCVDEVPQNIETGESSGTDEGQAEATIVKEPITEEVYSAEGGVSGEEPMPSSDDTGATGQSHRGSDHKPPEMFVNQMMNTAVKAANKAAANAYTTCKEVFYTWQARAHHPPNKQYKPPQQNWVPKGDKYIPPTSQWKPKQEKWVPPPQATVVKEQVTVTTKKETGPMAKLFEMGFCNRDINVKLLEKHDYDVQKVIQELLVADDNDWMAGRH